MRAFLNLILGFLLTTVINIRSLNVVQGNSNDIAQRQGTRATINRFTDVVNIAFCESHLPPEKKMGKDTLEEVHSYAELKRDPRASLPDSFTVCSTIMATDCVYPQFLTFFNILTSTIVFINTYSSTAIFRSRTIQ